MSAENLSHSQNSGIIQWSQIDNLKIIFNHDTPPKLAEEGFDFFRKNFYKEPSLINVLVDYYFLHGLANSTCTHMESCLLNSSNKKTVIDLICSIPEDLCIRFFDKVFDYMKQQQQLATQNQYGSAGQSASNAQSASTLSSTFFLYLERLTYLLVSICYRNNTWLVKLVNHHLFLLLIKIMKSNSLNELIVVHTSLLFVILMTSIPSHLFAAFNENLFLIYINLFKYLISLEQKTSSNDMIVKSVRWSVRLCFYVCYGIFPSQFIQFMRKKEQQQLNKDHLSSIFFFLRFHPCLLKEKNEVDKLSKQSLLDESTSSLEWRHYCLDPLFTTYNNQAIENLIKSGEPISSNTFANFQSFLSTPKTTSFISSNLSKTFASYNSNDSSKSSITQNVSNLFQFPTQKSHFIESSTSNSSSGLNNSTIVNLTEKFMRENACSSGSLVDNSSTIVEGECVQFDSKRARNSDENCLINMTTNMSRKKSLSDSSLFKSSDFSSQTQASSDEASDHKTNQDRLAQSFMATSTSASPFVYSPLYTSMNQQTQQSSSSNIRAQTTDQKRQCPFMPNSISRINHQIDAYDIVSGYFSNNSSCQIDLANSSDSSMNMANYAQRLKQEMDHLVLQLKYERHLREKYEESSNRLYSFKIERDQLQVEKSFLEVNLKQLVERYKNEIEESLSIQNQVEFDAYKRTLEEKDLLIENLLNKQTEYEMELNQYKESFSEMKAERDRFESSFSNAVQQLEKEQNLNLKNQVDTNLMKSMRNMTDLMRKKMLILTKSFEQAKLQQQMQFAYSQDLSEVPLIFNEIDNLVNLDGSSTAKTGNTSIDTNKSAITPFVYQYQQNTIELLTQQIDTLKSSYDKLLIEHNQNAIELDTCKQALQMRDAQIEELNQTIQIDSIESNSEILKIHRRVYQSISNVNKRLEMEVFKLKAELEEKDAIVNRLNMLMEQQKQRNDKPIVEASQIAL